MQYLMCFLPPLAVLSTGKMGTFVLSCVLTLLGYVPGVIHAFFVVSGHHADKRTNRMIKALQQQPR